MQACACKACACLRARGLGWLHARTLVPLALDLGDANRLVHVAEALSRLGTLHLRRELRRARLSDALLGWRDVRRRRAQERMLLLVDAFRRMWVFLHTQRLASRLLEVDTSP